jgi:hypothetical protein
MKNDVLNETTASTDILKIKMGRAKRPVQELRCNGQPALIADSLEYWPPQVLIS